MTNSAPITRDEMIEMFGEAMPIEAVNLVWNGPDGMTVAECRAKLREIAEAKKRQNAAFDQLSELERERVESEARETLYQVFNAAHNATGWCGDVMDECWQAGLPVMKETLARLVLRTR